MVIKEINVRNIFTKSNLPSADYSVNPYVGCSHACKYCYASFMKKFTGHSEQWGAFVDVKYWEKIKNPNKYDGKQVFIGSVTDPYMPIEAKYERTRALLEELQGSNSRITIATKSDLVLRDMELIKSFPNIMVSFSINTLNEEFKEVMDNAVSIERRINAMKILHENGIDTTCFISPIFPGTDVKSIIMKVREHCSSICLENLNLRGDYKETVLNYIRAEYPKLFQLYHEIYNKGKRDYWEKLTEEIIEFCREQKLVYLRNDDAQTTGINNSPVVVNYFYHGEITK